MIHNVEEIPTVLEYFAHENVAVWSTMEGEIRGGDRTDRLMRYISFWQDASGKRAFISSGVKERGKDVATVSNSPLSSRKRQIRKRMG